MYSRHPPILTGTTCRILSSRRLLSAEPVNSAMHAADPLSIAQTTATQDSGRGNGLKTDRSKLEDALITHWALRVVLTVCLSDGSTGALRLLCWQISSSYMRRPAPSWLWLACSHAHQPVVMHLEKRFVGWFRTNATQPVFVLIIHTPDPYYTKLENWKAKSIKFTIRHSVLIENFSGTVANSNMHTCLTLSEFVKYWIEFFIFVVFLLEFSCVQAPFFSRVESLTIGPFRVLSEDFINQTV